MSTEIPAEFEEYRLVRPLGRGAMGQVYLAHDRLLDRLVAVKFLAAIHPDETSRERFLVEARAIARLQHPNVVAIYRIGEAGGRPYLVSEFIAGQGLEALPHPLPQERTLEIALGLARGLSAAHRRGVLHRDIKPANVLLSESGEVKLLDFGLAKLTEATEGPRPAQTDEPPMTPPTLDGEGGVSLTRTGAILGTPLYVAPELWSGAPATMASDVYALGAVLYELCTGHPPHHALSLKDLRQAVLTQDARPLRDAAPLTDPGFAAVVDRCLRRDPASRYPSALTLCQALEDLRRTSPTPGPPAHRSSVGALLAAAGLILAAAGAGIAWSLWPDPEPPQRAQATQTQDLAPRPDLAPRLPDLAPPPQDLSLPPDLRQKAASISSPNPRPGKKAPIEAPRPAPAPQPQPQPPGSPNDGEEFIIR